MDLTTPDLVRERATDPARFAIGGVAPGRAARPRDRDELCEIVRAAARDGLVLVPWGGGVVLATDAAPPRYDLALDLGALDRVIEYEPADVTITAECGATLAALRALIAARGQELPIEGAHPGSATLGGAIACNTSGPRRMRFGAPRDRILGARWVLGDGTLVRTGGKVVKNVAGYGIHRLLCGSRGGLAIVVDASLKLLPGPAARAALIYALDDEVLLDDARWAAIARLEPAVLTAVDAATAAAARLPAAAAGATWVAVGLEDDPPRIEQCRAIVESALGRPALALAGGEVEALWQALCDLEGAMAPRVTFTSAHLTPAALAALRAPEAAPLARGWLLHAAGGRLHVSPGEGGAGSVAGAAAALVARLAETGFTRIAAHAVEAAAAIPPAAAVTALRARIRAALDPGSRMAYGDRWEHATG